MAIAQINFRMANDEEKSQVESVIRQVMDDNPGIKQGEVLQMLAAAYIEQSASKLLPDQQGTIKAARVHFAALEHLIGDLVLAVSDAKIQAEADVEAQMAKLREIADSANAAAKEARAETKAVIAERDELLAEKDARITELLDQVADLDNQLTDARVELSEREAAITTLGEVRTLIASINQSNTVADEK